MRGDLEGIRRGQQLADRALTIFRSVHGPRHPRVGEALNTMLQLWNQRAGLEPLTAEMLEQMDSMSREAVELHRAIYSEPHDELSASLSHRAVALRRHGQYDAAEEAVREAIAITEKTRPHDETAPISGLRQLAHIAFERGEYEESVARYREVRDLWAGAFGDAYLLTLTAEFPVAEALAAAGNFEEAESTLLRVYEALDSQRGRYDRFTQEALRHLADLYEAYNRPDEAERFRQLLRATAPNRPAAPAAHERP